MANQYEVNMSSIVTKDYGKVFNSLCHFMALSQTVDIKAVLNNLVVSAITFDRQTNAISFAEIKEAVEVYFSTEITEQDLRNSIDDLITANDLIVVSKDIFQLQNKVAVTVNNRVKESKALEERVKQEWLVDIAKTAEKYSITSHYDIEHLWTILQTYLAKSFYRHGAQTTQIFDPTFNQGEDVSKNLSTLLQESILKSNSPLRTEFIKECVREFLGTQSPDKVAYLAELLDGTFTFFALNVDDAISNFLSGAFKPLTVFLDTNFIFGILNLHNNPLVEISNELVDIISRNFPNISLVYHIATVEEMTRTINALGEQLLTHKWDQSLSRAGLRTNQLTGLYLKYHEENANALIDPKIFLQKYQNPIPILTEKGFQVYETMAAVDTITKGQLIAEYKAFIESKRKPKPYLAYDHDISVLLSAEENRGYEGQYSILDAGAMVLTCDYYLYAFDRYEHSTGRIGQVVLPNHFLQLLRPLLPRNADFDKRFVATFAIPEFRSIDSDYAETVSKVMMYLSTYKDLSEESAAKILGNNALIHELSGVDEKSDNFANSIESALAKENEELIEEVAMLRSELEDSNQVITQRENELTHQTEQATQLQEHVKTLAKENQAVQEKLDTKQNEYRDKLLNIKARLNERAHKYAQRWLVIIIGVGIAISLLSIYLDQQFHWNAIYFIDLIVFVISYGYYAYSRKELNPRALYEDAVSRKKNEFYKEYGVDLDKIE